MSSMRSWGLIEGNIADDFADDFADDIILLTVVVDDCNS